MKPKQQPPEPAPAKDEPINQRPQDRARAELTPMQARTARLAAEYLIDKAIARAKNDEVIFLSAVIAPLLNLTGMILRGERTSFADLDRIIFQLRRTGSDNDGGRIQ